MLHRLLAVAVAVVLFTGSAFAMDIDRHANYTEGEAGAAVAKCKNFIGTDDNRGACTDWCSSYTDANKAATCTCDEGACSDEPAAAAAPAAPAATH